LFVVCWVSLLSCCVLWVVVFVYCYYSSIQYGIVVKKKTDVYVCLMQPDSRLSWKTTYDVSIGYAVLRSEGVCRVVVFVAFYVWCVVVVLLLLLICCFCRAVLLLHCRCFSVVVVLLVLCCCWVVVVVVIVNKQVLTCLFSVSQYFFTIFLQGNNNNSITTAKRSWKGFV